MAQRSIVSFFAAASSAKKKPALHIGLPDEDGGKPKNAGSSDSPVAKAEKEASNNATGKRFRGEKNDEDVGAIPGESNIGKRLKVYWSKERKYFPGVVAAYDTGSGKHRIVYDDGDEECIVLAKEKFSWLDDEKHVSPRKATTRSNSDGVENSGGGRPNPEHRGMKRTQGLKRKRQCVVTSSDEDNGEKIGEQEEEGNDSKMAEVSSITGTSNSVRRRRLTKAESKVELDPEGDASKASNCKDLPVPLGQKPEVSAKLKIFQEEVREVEHHKTFVSEVHAHVGDKLSGEAFSRFGGRVAAKFPFLEKFRRDASGSRPDSPSFDPRTLFLPAEFLKGLTGGQRQWWEFKAKHMDKVLLFKMGKFYEMFEMDAHIGVQDLDLQYMKGEQPHCGFPEKNYAENAQRLARKGHRVLVVEQTETPEQLESRKRQTGAKDKVVRREICAVITKGTMVDADMVGDNADTAFLLALAEKDDVNGGSVIGLCVVDTSRAFFMLGQINDDAARTKLKSILSELRPVELVKPKGVLADATERALHAQTRKPLINSLIPNMEFWSAEKTIEELSSIYSDKQTPDIVQNLLSLGVEGEPVLSALGGCISYLRQVLLDHQLLKLGRMELLPGSGLLVNCLESNVQQLSSNSRPSESYMVLDSAALENLEILENNSNGGTSGTLLGLVDSCVTPFGRRLLKQWIVRPLLRIGSIIERQDAIEDLQCDAGTAVSGFRKELAGIPDIERLLARLSATSGANGRDGDNVVLYEDAVKRRLKELLAALRGCKTMMKAISCFQSCYLKSDLLQALVTPGRRFPHLDPLVQYFEEAFDWSEAEQSGQIKLNKSVDEETPPAVHDTREQLEDYLKKQRKRFKTDEISYVNVSKDTYLLEIPDHLHSKVPSDFELRSSRKGYRRYWTPEIKVLLQELSAAEEQKELLAKGTLQMLAKRLCRDRELILLAVQAVSELDALMSLSSATLHMEAKTCKPSFSRNGGPVFTAKALRHPIMSIGGNSSVPFVPNDVVLGENGAPHFMLLTGPNMGGKSTLLRQVCLAIILAQVGAYVPAEALVLSPTDRLFVRMGAKDHIMSGQSTFLMELLETASMLRCASTHSFVALDELGRGTATTDGQAIAHAVLHHLSHKIQCRGLFSTHYHRLADDHAADNAISLQHMACNVDVGSNGLEAVTFLYKLTAGSCPKSYGANVARLAGMPESVLASAASQSKKLEEDERQFKEVQLINDILEAEDKRSKSLIQVWRDARKALDDGLGKAQ